MTGRIVVGLALVGLLLGCFGRLVADPSGLIVDADRPSVDHARVSEDRSAGNDLTRLFLPHHLAIARSIARNGRPPLWDDRGFGGRPLVGNPQGGLFYPPVWLAWWSGTPSALGWITVGHLFWSGLGAYRLARTLGMSRWGGLVTAGCVQASPYVLAQTFEGHYPHVWAASWSPWAFDAAIRIRRGELLAPPALVLILAATFLAGHPQEGYYLVIALGCWAMFDGWAAIRSGQGRWALRLWGLWASVLILVLGILGVELVPGAMVQEWVLRGSRLSVRLASRYHLDAVNILQLLSPRALGGPSDYIGQENYWESVVSIGLIPLILAIVGAVWSADRRAARGWLILVGAALVFASGRRLGLFTAMFHLIPAMNRFRVPARSLFLASLGASVLAGLGVDVLRSKAFEEARWPVFAHRSGRLLALLILVVVCGAWSASGREVSGSGSSRVGDRRAARSDRIHEADRWVLGLGRVSSDPVFWFALGSSMAVIAWGGVRPANRRGLAAVLGLLGLVELGYGGHQLIQTSPADRFLGADPISQALRDHRPPGREPVRIRAVDALFGDLRAVPLGVSKTNVNDSFQIQAAADLYEPLYPMFDPDRFDRGRPMDAAVDQHRREVRQAILDRLGVSMIIADREVPGSSWPVRASGLVGKSRYVVLENPTVLPRAYVVPRVEVALDDRSIVDRFPEVDPRAAALMPDDPLGIEDGPRQPFTPAEWTSDDPDRVVLQVMTEAPGLLIVAQTWMPGWSAQVDGRDAPVLRGNHAQQVVPLPQPGSHEVILTYRTPGLATGLALSVGSMILWASWLIRQSLRRLSLTRPRPIG